MKKILLVCALCMCIVLAGCNDETKEVIQNSVDNENNTVETTEGTEIEILDEEGINGFVSDVNWKETFAAKLAAFPEEEAVKYVLYDLDQDNAPEMIIVRGEIEADKLIYICDCIGEDSTAEVLVEEFGSSTRIAGLKEENTVLFQYGFQGIERVGRIHYANGAYDMEIIREISPEQGLEYMPLKGLDMFDKSDLTGLEWTENPADDNFQWVNAGNGEA